MPSKSKMLAKTVARAHPGMMPLVGNSAYDTQQLSLNNLGPKYIASAASERARGKPVRAAAWRKAAWSSDSYNAGTSIITAATSSFWRCALYALMLAW